MDSNLNSRWRAAWIVGAATFVSTVMALAIWSFPEADDEIDDEKEKTKELQPPARDSAKRRVAGLSSPNSSKLTALELQRSVLEGPGPGPGATNRRGRMLRLRHAAESRPSGGLSRNLQDSRHSPQSSETRQSRLLRQLELRNRTRAERAAEQARAAREAPIDAPEISLELLDLLELEEQMSSAVPLPSNRARVTNKRKVKRKTKSTSVQGNNAVINAWEDQDERLKLDLPEDHRQAGPTINPENSDCLLSQQPLQIVDESEIDGVTFPMESEHSNKDGSQVLDFPLDSTTIGEGDEDDVDNDECVEISTPSYPLLLPNAVELFPAKPEGPPQFIAPTLGSRPGRSTRQWADIMDTDDEAVEIVPAHRQEPETTPEPAKDKNKAEVCQLSQDVLWHPSKTEIRSA